MIKSVMAAILACTTPLFALANPTWNNIPAPNFSASNQLMMHSQYQMQQSMQQFTDTIVEYAESENQREYDEAVHKIRQNGGDVSRSGDNIYITNYDGTRMYCYAKISRDTCEMSNY